MALYAFSDLHIDGPDDPLYSALIRVVRDQAQPGDTLLLLGDVFDLFVGDKKIFRDRYADLLKELRAALARDVDVHYVEGNHDFLLHRAMGIRTGLKLHKKESSLTVAGKRFYVAHGDLVDRDDLSYRALRIFFRSPLMRLLVWALPGKFWSWFGSATSRYSRSCKPVLPAHLSTERLERLRRIYRSFAAEKIAQGFDYVLLGHCHDLDEMAFRAGDREGQYINMGFPRTHGSYLVWEPGSPRVERTAF